MIEIFLALTCALLALTLASAFLYYRRIREVKEKYLEAKEVVGDIVVSFNRQLSRQAEALASTNSKAETAYLRSEVLERKLGDLEKKIEGLELSLEDLKKEVKGFDEKLKAAAEAQKGIEELKNKVKELEELSYHVTVEGEEAEMEERVPAIPIPIRKDKVLASLTSTELAVLEILASEGPKTAPQIRDRIKLTREHTARLMKKLYEKGFLERDTSKIPYSYRIKEEMLRLLKKKSSE